jgi:YidC/Oxa1 family membrane protein insertase
VNIDITYQFMIPMLMYFAKVTHSYGWAIVLLTLAVRLLVWPLVAKQTQSMAKMSQLQPQLKLIQERYKDNQEMVLKKTQEFYSKNKLNPMGGCLPLLIQLPILLALFGTFSGPPFGDKTVDVKVKVVEKAQAAECHRNETSGGSVPYISTDETLGKVVVFPGDSTIVKDESIDFAVRPSQGVLPDNFKVYWQIYGKEKDIHGIINHEPYGSTFHTNFTNTGDFIVKAKVPAIAKDESFGFIKSLGKVAKGVELLKPENIDSVILIVLFGGTMWLSQKLTVPKQQPGLEISEQQMAQQQAMKSMPIMMTVMFFFIPLPTGVFLYMVISNVMQSLQTWIIMKQPTQPLVAVLDVEDGVVENGVVDIGSVKLTDAKSNGKPKGSANSDNNGKSKPNKVEKTDKSGTADKVDKSDDASK